MAALEGAGYHVTKVEHWNPYAHVMNDLWGFADLLAIRPDEVLAVQVTTGDHLANRITKITDHPNLPVVRAAGIRIEAHGWRKVGKPAKWDCRVVDLS